MGSIIDPATTAVFGGGSVEYSLSEAVTDIDELIAALERAKEDGATHVVASSGNYRGARWARISAQWSWADE